MQVSIKIVADSSCDLNNELRKELGITLVPFTLHIGEHTYRDDEQLDVKTMIKEMTECPTSPRTACPSPNEFIKAFEGPESIFAVTISSALSGTYESAMLAKKMLLENAEGKFVHVFDSMSASVGETLICGKIKELAEEGFKEIQIVDKVSEYIRGMKTFFLLESLEHLAKAGRLSHLAAKVASVLDIKAIMGSNGEGNIRLVEKARGYRKAFEKLVEVVGKEGVNIKERVLGIAHCNCAQKAIQFKDEVLKRKGCFNFV
jgi:DegV family protein with EDD domain